VFFSCIPPKTVHAFLTSIMRATYLAHLILLDLITLMMFGVTVQSCFSGYKIPSHTKSSSGYIHHAPVLLGSISAAQ
jgi:hypothetical protein